MNVLIIDDHRLFADGLRLVINDMGNSEDYSVEQVYSAQRALDMINSGNHYDLILTDLDMPGINGHELVKSLISRKVGSYIAVVSASHSAKDISKAYRQGARGYICKSESAFQMQAKLRDLLDGKISYPDDFLESLEKGSVNPESGSEKKLLPKRPMEVLELLSQGKSNKQIASILNITETTVKFHIRTLFSTLGVNNRTWCVREANRRGLIEAQDS